VLWLIFNAIAVAAQLYVVLHIELFVQAAEDLFAIIP
jgi:hypothetical protein